MRMWSRLVKGFFLALVLMLLPVVAFSASKVVSGGSCKVYQQKVTYKNKIYTCIKSGKKLVWNKGFVLARPNPLATPTAIGDPIGAIGATPSPTAIATPSPTPIIERKDWEYVYLKIWDEFNAAQNQGTFPFVYKLSPNVNKEKAQESISAYDKAMKIWLAVLNGEKVNPVIWSIMSEKDYVWWRQVVDQQEGSSANYAWNPDTNMLGHCSLSSFAFCGYGNAFKANTQEYKFLQYNVIGSAYTSSPNANTVNHEAVHFYQLGVVQGFPRDTPCWYVEGQASLYGGALEYDLKIQRNRSINQRNNFKGIVRQYQPNADSYTAGEWITVLSNMYPPHVSCSGQQDYFKYASGTFIWEYLYDKFGPKVMHEVLLEFKNGKSFAEAIKKELNFSVEQLNQNLANHLVHVFADNN